MTATTNQIVAYNYLNRKVKATFVDGTVEGVLKVSDTGGTYEVDEVAFAYREIHAIREFTHPDENNNVAEFTVRLA